MQEQVIFIAIILVLALHVAGVLLLVREMYLFLTDPHGTHARRGGVTINTNPKKSLLC